MGIKYFFDKELNDRAIFIARKLFLHVKVGQLKCFRSVGSSSKYTIARCHTIGKLMQMTIGVPAHYGIEFLSENFDKLSKVEQDKVIIHELMHIPKSFGGGFRHHDFVCEENIDKLHKELIDNEGKDWW
jgi:predicted metallopeptidase